MTSHCSSEAVDQCCYSSSQQPSLMSAMRRLAGLVRLSDRCIVGGLLVARLGEIDENLELHGPTLISIALCSSNEPRIPTAYAVAVKPALSNDDTVGRPQGANGGLGRGSVQLPTRGRRQSPHPQRQHGAHMTREGMCPVKLPLRRRPQAAWPVCSVSLDLADVLRCIRN